MSEERAEIAGEPRARTARSGEPASPPRLEIDLLERLERRLGDRVGALEERVDRLEDRQPIDERELGEASLG